MAMSTDYLGHSAFGQQKSTEYCGWPNQWFESHQRKNQHVRYTGSFHEDLATIM
jgi:hypothetical protein